MPGSCRASAVPAEGSAGVGDGGAEGEAAADEDGVFGGVGLVGPLQAAPASTTSRVAPAPRRVSRSRVVTVVALLGRFGPVQDAGPAGAAEHRQ